MFPLNWGQSVLRLAFFVTLARPPTHSSLKITNCFFRYAAPSLWNELPTDLRERASSDSLLLFLLSHMAFHRLHLLHYHRLHHLLLAQCFILNSRLGSSANPFLHRPCPLAYYPTDTYTDSRTI